MLHLISIILTNKLQQQLLMMSLASHDANAGAIGITNYKNHVVSPFDHLDVTNAIEPLMTQLQSVMLHIVSVILTK